ncbi:disease resistance protein Roq1-like [Cornus florida]|uniref:disease resistance protein Roq1-like n=1 Tax=Cornus florida TaxID=4283 RepID=UPI0028977AC5|nr:disease resistance protein Roq1-like [Cornus florida]
MASSSSSIPQRKYDVFLSFRGEDTRKNFVDHLHAAIQQKGIDTFKDDEKIERGKSISTALLTAIKESRFAVIVSSKNYASSSWCLDELVEIIECKNKIGQIVFPIFYNVDPSKVRKQQGVSHKHLPNMKKILGMTKKRCKDGGKLWWKQQT